MKAAAIGAGIGAGAVIAGEGVEIFPGRGLELPPLPGTSLQEPEPIIPCDGQNQAPVFELPPFSVPVGPDVADAVTGTPLERPEVVGEGVLRSELSPRYTTRSHAHVWIRHHSTTHFKGKSKFLPGEGGQSFAEEVVAKGKLTIQADGRLRYDADLGRIVGTRGETRGRVILDPETGEVITQFPQK